MSAPAPSRTSCRQTPKPAQVGEGGPPVGRNAPEGEHCKKAKPSCKHSHRIEISLQRGCIWSFLPWTFLQRREQDPLLGRPAVARAAPQSGEGGRAPTCPAPRWDVVLSLPLPAQSDGLQVVTSGPFPTSLRTEQPWATRKASHLSKACVLPTDTKALLTGQRPLNPMNIAPPTVQYTLPLLGLRLRPLLLLVALGSMS